MHVHDYHGVGYISSTIKHFVPISVYMYKSRAGGFHLSVEKYSN